MKSLIFAFLFFSVLLPTGAAEFRQIDLTIFGMD